MGIKQIDPFTDKRWDEFVTHHPQGTIFHHSAWARVLQERYQTEPIYYVLENERGEITALSPYFMVPGALGRRRLVCLPCCEYCYPLVYRPEDLEILVNLAKETVQEKHLSHLEIRGFRGNFSPDKLALKAYSYYLNHVTTLDPHPQKLRAKFSRETRYHLNRGERSQVSVRFGQDENDLKTFHRLTSKMRRRINLLPWPYQFFQSIYHHLIQPGYGFLLLAELGGKIVSGGLFFNLKDTVINKFNASDAEYIQKRTNYLVMWKAIEYACEKGFRYFDFGVTNPENTGLIRFKSHWNSLETVLPYYYYPEIRGVNTLPENSLLYRLHTSINRVLPSFALMLTARLLYRRLG